MAKLTIPLHTGYFPFISYVTESAVSESTPINTVEQIQATIVGFKSPYYFGDDSWEENGITVGIDYSTLRLINTMI